MELDEMKTLWAEMSIDIEKQKKLTDTLIFKMKHADYRSKMNKIFIPELIGSLGCLAQVLFIFFNIQKLNTWYLVVCGIVASFILILLPILSIKAIRNIRDVNISDSNYKQSLFEYSRRKIQFVKVQKLSYYLGAVLLVMILPVMGQLLGGKDLFTDTRLWIWYAICFLMFYPFCQWVFKSYNKVTADAENILKELEG